MAPGLSQLTSLTRLDISTRDPSALAPGCLPSRLVSLLAVGVGGTSLLAGPLPRLQTLWLSIHPTGLNAAISRLTALAGLTSLGLGHTIGLRGPPAQLAALTNLQYLLLEIHPEEGVAVDFSPLLTLGQLSHLTLRADGLSSLPVNVLALPQLKVRCRAGRRASQGVCGLAATAGALYCHVAPAWCSMQLLPTPACS